MQSIRRTADGEDHGRVREVKQKSSASRRSDRLVLSRLYVKTVNFSIRER